MDLGLDNAVALVTGGSKGIGKACAKALLAEGAKVAILARGEAALKAAAEELGDVLTVSADTTDTAAVEAAVATVVETYGRLDVVVNAAAEPASSTPGGGSGLAAVDEADIIRQVDTKGLGYLRVVRAAHPHLKAAGGGRVVNIAGMNACTTGTVMGSVRNVAVVAIAKNLADELGRDNIAVTVVHPGITRTDSRDLTQAQLDAAAGNALGRIVDASEIADAVTFLASPRATALTGSVVEADGGRIGTIWG